MYIRTGTPTRIVVVEGALFAPPQSPAKVQVQRALNHRGVDTTILIFANVLIATGIFIH